MDTDAIMVDEREFVEGAVNRLGDCATMIRSILAGATNTSEAVEIVKLATALKHVESALMAYANVQNELIAE